jgi:hypothetical protein
MSPPPEKVAFALSSTGRGRFEARALEFPIAVDATKLSALRVMIAAAVRAHFGEDRKFVLLVGTPPGTPPAGVKAGAHGDFLVT